jgi:nucleoside phosphorylase/CheY-like chemotaxis protein
MQRTITQPSGITQDSPLSSLSNSESSADVNTEPRSILIVTVTKVEVEAVLEAFTHTGGQRWSRKFIGAKTYYNLGIHGDVPVFMAQSEMGAVTPGGALLTVHQAIQDLHPQAVIMCGIAFGLRPGKQKLGDILIAKQLECYEPQKIDPQERHLQRGDRTMCSERLLDHFRSGDIGWVGASTHFGLMLSGEKLVNGPDFRAWLLATEPEAMGGEMEGAGLYAAARDAGVDWILIKAICDWADGTKSDEPQSLAAHNAAQFVLHVIQLGGWAEHKQFNKEFPADRPEPVMFDLLVIDDREDWRAVIVSTFDNIYACDTAATYREAATKINAGNYKVVCLNWGFGSVYKGRGLLTLLKEKYPHVPVVLISGSLTEGGLLARYPNIKDICIKGNEPVLSDESVFVKDMLDIIPPLIRSC